MKNLYRYSRIGSHIFLVTTVYCCCKYGNALGRFLFRCLILNFIYSLTVDSNNVFEMNETSCELKTYIQSPSISNKPENSIISSLQIITTITADN